LESNPAQWPPTREPLTVAAVNVLPDNTKVLLLAFCVALPSHDEAIMSSSICRKVAGVIAPLVWLAKVLVTSAVSCALVFGEPVWA
jgi:hypothetical protein